MPLQSNFIHNRQKFLIATLVAGLVYLAVLWVLVYGVARFQTGPLLAGYGLLFGLYLLLNWGSKEIPLGYLLVLAGLARLLLLPALPSLSDDFYRFLWDGHLLVEGLHPFSHPPEWYQQAAAPLVPGLTPALYEGLNSKSYFTIYPPLAQALFALAAWLGGSNILLGVIALRLPILLAEAGSIWLMLKLLNFYQLPQRRVLLYAINPLVVLELVGNLHLEALAIFFLLLLLWAFRGLDNKQGTEAEPIAKKSSILGAVAFAGAVASKLWPLMLGPYLLMKMDRKRAFRWMLLSVAIVLILFVPLFGKPFIEGMSSSLSLYFQRFEFNASLYYLLRGLGQWIMGYNPIEQLGPLLGLLATGLILYLSRRSAKFGWSLPKTLLLLYGLFLLCATTVHPWYVLPLLALMPFTLFRFPLVWSAVVFLTYAGYSISGYQEPMTLVVIEYGVVLLFLVWEFKKKEVDANLNIQGGGASDRERIIRPTDARTPALQKLKQPASAKNISPGRRKKKINK